MNAPAPGGIGITAAFVVLGLVDLDPVDAVVRVLAHGGARKPRRIDVARELPRIRTAGLAERSDDGRRGIITGGARIQLRAGDLQARPGNLTFVDGVAQLDGGIGVGRAHVLQRGEACVQILERVIQSGKRGARVVGLLLLHQVHVTIDQAGQNGGAAEIDDLRARRNLDAIGGAGGGDAIAFNKDDLILQHRARFGVEQAAGADGDALRRGRLHVHARGVEGSGFGTGALGVDARRLRG